MIRIGHGFEWWASVLDSRLQIKQTFIHKRLSERVVNMNMNECGECSE